MPLQIFVTAFRVLFAMPVYKSRITIFLIFLTIGIGLLLLPNNKEIASQVSLDVTVSSASNKQKKSDKEKWEIRSVSAMKETKDRVCNPRTREYIARWVDKAKDLGVNYVAISTPYDNPSCGNALLYTQLWVDVIRSRKLKVWHRHMPISFEGIYNTKKVSVSDYITNIKDYITANPTLFSKGDIFTPIPEPQNGGIQGITYCDQSVCQFNDADDFNWWLREAIHVSEQAFIELGISGVRVGYYGFDGFVAWGHNNPNWEGVLEAETIDVMGNITIDHYPETVADTMENSLNQLQAKYPGVPIIIGEWGAVSGNNQEEQIETTLNSATRPGVIGFNYWHMGVGGKEALIDSSLKPLPQYFIVQSYFLP